MTFTRLTRPREILPQILNAPEFAITRRDGYHKYRWDDSKKDGMMAVSGCALTGILAAILACLGSLFFVPVGVETSPMDDAPAIVVTAQIEPLILTVTAEPDEDSWHSKPVEATPTPSP